MRRSPKSCRRSCAHTASATRVTRCARSATKCTTSIATRTSRNCSGCASARRASRNSRCLRRTPMRRWSRTTSTMCRWRSAKGRISATLALIYPPGIGVIVPGRALGRQGAADARLLPGFSRNLQPLPGFQLRSARRVSGAGGRPHQVPHLRGPRMKDRARASSDED